ncbi:MAG: hypothetical protein Q8O12_00185 [Candidatus Omnitrophota bacterium]|nr:hypothetical protein [Candidatus Omnitrophota bacterium]
MTESTPEGKLLNLIRNGQSKSKIGKDLKIFTKINIILIGIIGLVAIIFIADVFIFKEKPAAVPVVADTRVKAPEPAPQAPKIQPEPIAEKIEEAPIKRISKEEILGNLNLLGIITGDNNQAIIEDKTLKKTYFLYKGDSFGDLKVYDIKESAVILDYKGEKIELNI